MGDDYWCVCCVCARLRAHVLVSAFLFSCTCSPKQQNSLEYRSQPSSKLVVVWALRDGRTGICVCLCVCVRVCARVRVRVRVGLCVHATVCSMRVRAGMFVLGVRACVHACLRMFGVVGVMESLSFRALCIHLRNLVNIEQNLARKCAQRARTCTHANTSACGCKRMLNCLPWGLAADLLARRRGEMQNRLTVLHAGGNRVTGYAVQAPASRSTVQSPALRSRAAGARAASIRAMLGGKIWGRIQRLSGEGCWVARRWATAMATTAAVATARAPLSERVCGSGGCQGAALSEMVIMAAVVTKRLGTPLYSFDHTCPSCPPSCPCL
jgi:hypothetical protein